MQRPSDGANDAGAEIANRPITANRHKLVVSREAVVSRICDIVAAQCNALFGDRMISLILTGSAARDELTVAQSDAGWKLASDAEFLAVVRRTAESADSKLTDSVRREAASKLRSEGIDVSIDLAVVQTPYLRELPPHIFSYELRTCGKVVSGDGSVLGLIPNFAPHELSKQDAWRLLSNRMVEQLALVDDLGSSSTELTPRVAYATVKLYLDMATSYLVFAGHYAPTYRERAKQLLALVDQASDRTPFPLAKFASRVAECTSWKLSGDEESCDVRVEFWQEAISYMRRLWRWEMIQLTQASGDLTVGSLSILLARQLTGSQRLRGWMSIVKRRGWLRSCGQWPRWIRSGRASTPRYLVYRAAAELAFRLPCLIKHSGAPPRLDVDWDAIRETLPEPAPQSSSEDCAAWRKLASDVEWNYAQFLRVTRA